MANIFMHIDEEKPRTREEWEKIEELYKSMANLGQVFLLKNADDIKKLEGLLENE